MACLYCHTYKQRLTFVSNDAEIIGYARKGFYLCPECLDKYTLLSILGLDFDMKDYPIIAKTCEIPTFYEFLLKWTYIKEQLGPEVNLYEYKNLSKGVNYYEISRSKLY